jgi:glycosyltransferase involved in cell wall biosynthesis
MKILILHDVDLTKGLRRSTFNQSFCLPKYVRHHEFILHYFADPVTDRIGSADIDVIILDTTFLCYRWLRPRSEFREIRNKYDFVTGSRALKLAFPQDDYDHSAILDQWLDEWHVHTVFSPLSNFEDVLYPRFRKSGEILPCLTGYLDDVDLLMLEDFRRPFEERTIDVGYRARELPPLFGRLGRLKSEIGHRFVHHAGGRHGLNLDISTRPQDALHGADWLRFLGNCRFFLGSPSGSSLVDPDGTIKDAYLAFNAEHPDANFEEVEAACFPGLDDIHRMAALGPRNIEAAAAWACQILIEDPCWAPMEPDVHYIALRPDFGNIDQVLKRIDDRRAVQATIDACYDLLIRSGKYSYRRFAAHIMEQIDRKLGHQFPPDTINLTSSRALIAREQEIATDFYRTQIGQLSLERQRAIEALDASTRQLNFVRQEAEVQLAAVQEDAEAQLAALQAETVNRIATITGELNIARHDSVLRQGWFGVLREILRINDFIAMDGSPKPGARLTLPARLYFNLRSGLAANCLRKARAVLVKDDAVEHFPADPPRAKEIDPKALTMLVPDNRIDRRVLLSGRSLFAAGWQVKIISAPYPEPIDRDQLDFPELSIIRVDTTRAIQIPLRALPRNKVHRSNWQRVYFYHHQFLAAALQHAAKLYVAHDLPVLPAAAIAALHTGASLVYDAHELYPEQCHFSAAQKTLFGNAEAALIKNADLVTTINQSIATEMAARYQIISPQVILNAPAIPAEPWREGDLLRQDLHIPENKRILLYQGSLSLNRNLEDLIAAMAQLAKDDIALVMMGPGAEVRRKLERIASAGGTLGSRVFFRDAVPQAALLGYTGAAEVGIIPYPPIDLNSRYCTPNKLFDFIVAGLPILANDLPELRKFVHDNGFGQVHPLDGPVGIARAIETMFAADLGVYRQRLAARRHEFVWGAQGEKLVSLYRPFAAQIDEKIAEAA